MNVLIKKHVYLFKRLPQKYLDVCVCKSVPVAFFIIYEQVDVNQSKYNLRYIIQSTSTSVRRTTVRHN